MALPRFGGLVLVVLLLGATPAQATTIEGIEFTDLVLVDVPGGSNLLLTTSEDVYVFVPNGLFADGAELIAIDQIIIDAPIDANTVSLCADPLICATGAFDLQNDVLVTVLDPVGSFRIEAGGSIVLSTTPIPEPSTSVLVVLGLLSLGAWRRSA